MTELFALLCPHFNKLSKYVLYNYRRIISSGSLKCLLCNKYVTLLSMWILIEKSMDIISLLKGDVLLKFVLCYHLNLNHYSDEMSELTPIFCVFFSGGIYCFAFD